jgi:hypothetical protein
MDGKNDNTDELKRERRSLLGKIERRETAVIFAQRDIRNYRLRLRLIEQTLAERKSGK